MRRLHNDILEVEKPASTQKTVARLAGVSTGTVSRVLNNHPKVTPAVRQAVEAAIRELDYKPDPVAQSLRRLGSTGRMWTGNIGVVFINTTSAMLELPFMARMIQAVQRELVDNGLHLILSNTTDAVSLPDLVRDKKVEGVIVHGDLRLELSEKLTSSIPVVSMGQNNLNLPVTMVNVNNKSAIMSGMKYLYELGHRRIGFVTFEPQHKDFAERLLGYRDSFELLGLPYDSALESVGQPRWEQGPRQPAAEPPVMDELIEPLLKLPSPPTALIVANDWQAIGVYRALQRRGVRIPEDMSVIGFDNDQGVCQSLSPALTSLDYPSEQIGRTAVQMLLKQLKQHNPSLQETLLIKSNLIERASCRARP